MIVQKEEVINGVKFIHTYSDAGYKIERDGEVYGDAYDPAEYNREYTETDELIKDRDRDREV